MLSVITTQLIYHKWVFAIFISIAFFVLMIDKLLPYSPTFVIFLLGLLTIQNLMIYRSREKREILFARLPVTYRRLASARILLVVFALGIIFVFYLLFRMIFSVEAYDIGLKLTGFYMTLLLLFSAYFCARDLLLYALRHNALYKLTKERAQNMIMFSVLLLNLLGLFVFYLRPKVIGHVFEFIFEHNPYASITGVAKITAIALLFVVFSILTYTKRRSYLE